MHQFRKILKYRTQEIFNRFIADGIFNLIQETLKEYSDHIQSSQELALYVYGLHYYDKEISNDDESFLNDHIVFCIDYLSRHNNIEFHPRKKVPVFPRFKEESQAVEYFFEHNEKALKSLDMFIGLFKDICPTENVNEFCSFLRANIGKGRKALFDESKNAFSKLVSKLIKEKAQSTNIKLYKDIRLLLPQRFKCKRSPLVDSINGKTRYIFIDKNGHTLFYAFEDGNKNREIPKSHDDIIEVEILEKDSDGNVTLWKWSYAKDTN